MAHSISFYSVTIIISTYNRYSYLKKFLNDLTKSKLPTDTQVIIIDDASTDPRVIKLLKALEIKDVRIKKIYNQNRSSGVNEKCLKQAFEYALKSSKSSHYCIIDPDTILNVNWLQKLLDFNTKQLKNPYILSAYSSHAHEILKEHNNHRTVESLGGVNMFFTTETLLKYVLKSLDSEWDWKLCQEIIDSNGGLYTLSPSYIQHQGSFGQFSKGPLWYDFSVDFIDNSLLKNLGLRSLAKIKQSLFANKLYAARRILKK